MKPRKPPRRQVFVLTPEEKRAVACVVGAFLLGLGTMHYRARHPRAEAKPTAKEQGTAKAAVAKTSRASGSSARAQPTATPAADDGDGE
jgi:hypothetical protein